VVRNYLHTEFLPLEARIRAAGAERSVEVGYMIGDFLANAVETVQSLFMPPREPLRVASRMRVGPLAHRH
jgi:hypothetical protein